MNTKTPNQIDEEKKNLSKTTQGLMKKGVTNHFQLRRFFPNKYQDFSHQTGCTVGYAVCLGTLLSCQQKTSQSGKNYFLVRITDNLTQQIFKVLIFNQPYAFKYYQDYIGQTVIVAGNMTYDYGSYSILGPDILSNDIEHNMQILPVYPKIDKVKQFYMRKQINEACHEMEEETLPQDFLTKYTLANISWSLYEMHNPYSIANLQQADKRLLFDDLFYFAAQNELSEREYKQTCAPMDNMTLAETVRTNFGYPFTADQESTFQSISNNMKAGKIVNALVQGDVSCGKSVVAFALMAQAVGSGKQAIIMAPTTVLAEQHYNALCELLPECKEQICLAAGKKKLNKKELAKVSNGEYKFFVGTHALISESMKYKDLGLVIIDEEHKFGVEQRAAFEKQRQQYSSISMSATPIPRTLAKTLFNNSTQVYSIKTMPPGRKPIYTAYDNGQNVHNYIASALSRDEQVYIVCPAIETNEDKMPGVMSVSEALEHYQSMFPNTPMAMLNGKMKPAETQQILADFKANKIKILLSTTVIEVGVNVPNATLIVLQNAERFGLAGMHQLRGRVGRGSAPSCCLLVSAKPNERIETLCRTQDGFVIAEEDFKIRKSGSLFGVEQSGYNKFVEEVMNNNDIYVQIRDDVKAYSKRVLQKHILKLEMSHNQKRRVLYGHGGLIDELTKPTC